jgi:hypothetical protein
MFHPLFHRLRWVRDYKRLQGLRVTAQLSRAAGTIAVPRTRLCHGLTIPGRSHASYRQLNNVRASTEDA